MTSSALAEGDLQPLFHQLVFECKVHSALYGSCFASLSSAFHVWRWLASSSDAEEWRSEVDSLRSQLSVALERAGALEASQKSTRDTAVLSPHTDDKSIVGAASLTKKNASRELAAFRTAREQLHREANVAAASATGDPTSTAIANSPNVAARLEADVHARRSNA